MSDKSKSTVEMSLIEFELKNQEMALLNSRIEGLYIEKGVLAEKVKNLNEKLEANEIKVVVGFDERSPFGFNKKYFETIQDIRIDTNKAKQLLEGYENKKLQDEIADLEAEIEDSNDTIKTLQSRVRTVEGKAQDNRQALNDEFDVRRNTLAREYETLKLNLREDYETKAETLRKNITELSEELTKERENKTDRELAEKRRQEIATLNSRVAELETELERLKSTGFFRRMWESLTFKSAQREAAVKVERSKRAFNDVISKSVNYARVPNPFFNNWNWNIV